MAGGWLGVRGQQLVTNGLLGRRHHEQPLWWLRHKDVLVVEYGVFLVTCVKTVAWNEKYKDSYFKNIKPFNRKALLLVMVSVSPHYCKLFVFKHSFSMGIKGNILI